jgi:hypothetical protein
MIEIHFGTPRFRKFDTFDLHFPSEYSVPEVLDQAPRIHLKSMALVHFETSAFGSLNFPRLLPPRMLPPEVHNLSNACPPTDRWDYESFTQSFTLFRLRGVSNSMGKSAFTFSCNTPRHPELDLRTLGYATFNPTLGLISLTDTFLN